MGMIKTEVEIQKIRNTCKLTSFILDKLITGTEVGDSGLEIDKRARKLFKEANLIPAFLGLYGFPSVLCISVNDNVIHCIPDSEPFKNGDVIKYDIGGKLDGYCSDMARTFIVGQNLNKKVNKLVKDAKEGLDKAIEILHDGVTVLELATAIEKFAHKKGYGNVQDYFGHGIGENVHEPPEIHNSPKYIKQNIVLKEGMVIAVEPMFTLGSGKLIKDANNPWLIKTVDGSIGTHFEDTVLITKTGHEILTR